VTSISGEEFSSFFLGLCAKERYQGVHFSTLAFSREIEREELCSDHEHDMMNFCSRVFFFRWGSFLLLLRGEKGRSWCGLAWLGFCNLASEWAVGRDGFFRYSWEWMWWERFCMNEAGGKDVVVLRGRRFARSVLFVDRRTEYARQDMWVVSHAESEGRCTYVDGCYPLPVGRRCAEEARRGEAVSLDEESG